MNNTSLNVCSYSLPCSIFAVDQHLKTPYVLNWNLNVQQAITSSSVLQIAYVANHGVRLYSDVDLNQVDPARDDRSEQLGRPLVQNCPPSLNGSGLGGPCFPYISFLNYLGNKSTSSYQSLQVTFTKRYSSGLYLLAGYTYGHAIDTAGNTNNLGFAPQDSNNYNAEKASGDYDIRHRLTFSATYDVPSRKSWGQLLEGWQLTSIAMWETGPPILFFDNSNDLTGTGEGPGNANNDRWNISGSPKNLKWSQSAPIPFLGPDNAGNQNPTCLSVANTAALQNALNFAGGCYAQNGTIIYPNAFFTFGNMGRNIFRGPGFVNWDASVGKIWRLNERVRLQFRGEVFNLLNHPNFAPGSIGGDLTSPGSLGLASATPDVQAANPVIGSGGSRQAAIGERCLDGASRSEGKARSQLNDAWVVRVGDLTEQRVGDVCYVAVRDEWGFKLRVIEDVEEIRANFYLYALREQRRCFREAHVQIGPPRAAQKISRQGAICAHRGIS